LGVLRFFLPSLFRHLMCTAVAFAGICRGRSVWMEWNGMEWRAGKIDYEKADLKSLAEVANMKEECKG